MWFPFARVVAASGAGSGSGAAARRRRAGRLHRQASDGLLRAIATASQGSFILVTKTATLEGLRFHEPQIVRINQHRDLELWSTWITLVLAAAFLAAEWTLRRRWGLA